MNWKKQMNGGLAKTNKGCLNFIYFRKGELPCKKMEKKIRRIEFFLILMQARL
jgi:hypothetical protein